MSLLAGKTDPMPGGSVVPGRRTSLKVRASESASTPRWKPLALRAQFKATTIPNTIGDPAAKPWIFYGPTLNAYPDQAENWMHQQFIDAGIAIAGVDVGEAYGSPAAFPWFEALYQKMVADGYSTRPVLLGRSRGGLWVSSWAIAHPDRVAGIAGIYPVYDFTTYPGLETAAPAYNLSPSELAARLDELNPIRGAETLARAKIPVFIIHGTDDKVVPLAENSGTLEQIYETAGAGDLIEVMKAEGQGHSFWPGFFNCAELVEFVIARASGKTD